MPSPMDGYGTYAQLETKTYGELEDGYWYQGLEVLGPDVPCGETPEIGGTVTATFYINPIAGRGPVPHGWTTFHWYMRRGHDLNIGPMYIGWQIEDKNLQVLE